MANDKNNIENDAVNNADIRRAENKKRDYRDELDARQAKELIDKVNKRRGETLKKYREKENTAETYKSYGTHGLDFSGHERHGINEITAKIHSAEPDAALSIPSNNKNQDAKPSDKTIRRASLSDRSAPNDEYTRQASEHYRERRQMEKDNTKSVKTEKKSVGNADNKPIGKPDNKASFSSYGVGKVMTSRIENGAITFSQSKRLNSKVSDKPNIKSEHNTISSLPIRTNGYTARTLDNSKQNYMRQSSASPKSGFSDLSKTFHINNIPSPKTLRKQNFTPPYMAAYSLPIQTSSYTARTLNNSKQNYVRQSPVTAQNNISDLSDKKVRFQYAKAISKNALNTTERIYTTAGRSIYRISSQRGDYDTIHNFEQMRRGVVGTVAAMHVVSNIPYRTVARTAAIGTYTKATLGNMSRYVKGSNSEKILTEAESLRNFVGPLSKQQMQRYEFLKKELRKNAPLNVTPTTMKQLRAEMSNVFTRSQYKDIAEKYGSLSKLKLPEITKQIAVLSEKQRLGIISDFQKLKLKRLGELKELHTTAIRENKQLMKLSASRVNKEMRTLQKLKKAGTLSAAQKIRLEKLTELKELHNLKGRIHKNIRARRNLNIAFSQLIHQTMSKSDDAGLNGLFMATDICTNRYTKAIVREIVKLEKFAVRNTVRLGAVGIKKISDKTGLTKQVTALKTKTTKTLMNTKPANAARSLKGKVNGEIYSKVKKKISAKTPSGVKTAAKKTKAAVEKIKTTGNKITIAARRGYEFITKPFVKVKRAVAKVVKVSKIGLLAAGGILLLFYIIIALTSVISSATSSVILEEVSNLNEYIELLNDKQTEFKEKLSELGEGYKNVIYNYTDGSKMNNTREILCMATVYFGQDFSDKDSVKTYLTQLFNVSHFYSTEESETYYCSEGAACGNKKVTYKHHANGSEEIIYTCLGHKDLTVTITALAFDEIFSTSLNATGVGDLCFAFETGGQTLGSYNCWYCEDIGDGAGMNYGMMSANRAQARSLWNYIKANSENFARQFAGTDTFTGDNLNPFGSAFNNIWKGTHSPDDTAEMEQLQRAWVWNAYGTIWCADFQSRTGVDMTRSWALCEVALSRAVHRGAYSARVFGGCVNSSMTDEEIIDAIYDYECSHLPSFMSRWNLERVYAKSFLGRDFPSSDTEQFSWTEDNIEWCKNLYDQDWEELYEGLAGLNSASVGSGMSDAEVEALIGSLDGLSEERRNILSWACSAVGVIPYHWDWRSYWTINADDWGIVTTPDYKGRNLKGLDCSGFVIWCYNKAGYDPVTCGWGAKGYTGTIADSPQTVRIPNTDLKPGDIGMSGTWPYTHTGIYAGNGKWIHCTGAPTNNTVLNSYGGFTTYYKLINLD